MGGIDDIRGKRIYLDANLFIYVVEKSAEHALFLEALLGRLETGEAAAVTSELTLAEVLAKPLGQEREDIAAIYDEMVSPSGWLSMVPVERPILVAAARLRSALGLKPPDAIHVASAVAAGCHLFLSNDQRMRVPAGLELRPLVA